MQTQSFGSRYLTMRREKIQHGLQQAKRNKVCYLFLAPYAILFFTFFILPIGTSIYYSFTYYNILEPARFIGFQNYINLILQDEVFLTAVKNTFVIAVITGPVGYILSFLFAWFINELPKWLRAVAVVIFYAPSIAANAYTVFSIIFQGDAYGWFNAILMEYGLIDAPKLWLLDPTYMMTILIIVIYHPAEHETHAAVRRGYEYHLRIQRQRRSENPVRISFHGLRGAHSGYPPVRLRLQPV